MTNKSQKLTVIHFPSQPHFFSYGGFDIQMNRVIEMTNSEHITAKRVDLWSKKEVFEIAHFWGASNSNKLNIIFCKENGIKVIISGLFVQKSLTTKYKIKIWKFINRFTRNESVIYDADIITVINDAQAEVIEEYYGYPKKQIRIIPTILDDYLYVKPTSFFEKENFVLCVGTICSRKNQIKLALATIELGVKCVFVGRFDSREQGYKEQFLSLQDFNKGLIEHYIDISIVELCALYEKCCVVSCISQVETEPASILEGMHFKKAIIASNLPFAKIKKFSGIILCNQNKNKSIKEALKRALKNENNVDYNYFNSRDNSSKSVINLYNSLYQELDKTVN
tara:strand:- start:1191 stop:2204 length:1014 start_codon:yes stop_codon:yes gene_type:complete